MRPLFKVLLGLLVLVIFVSIFANSNDPEQIRQTKAIAEARERDAAKETTLRSACRTAKKAVESKLKAPATAEFSACTTNVPNPGVYIVAGHVDSQNAFGAKLRARWIVKLVDQGSKWLVEDVAVI